MSNSTLSDKSFAGFQKQSYFGALDGLRAISILMVLLHHTNRFAESGPLATLQENGRYGVGFFFVISGFLICTLFLREEAKTGGIDLWKFYGRRTLRLLPLYYAVLLLQTILVFVLHQYSPENQQLFRDKLPSYLFYFSNWLPTSTQGPFFCAWSLAVEEQFYLAFGLLLFFVNRRVVIAVVAAMFLLKVFVYQMYGAVDANSALWRIVFSYREPILLGVLAAFALNRPGWFGFFRRWFSSPVVLTIVGVASAAWLCIHQMQHESFWDAQLLYAAMTALVIGLVIRVKTPVLCSRFLTHVGKISYGIYLLHMFVISTVRKLPGGDSPVIGFLLTTVTVIILASVVYKFFERPIIEFYKDRLSPLNAPSVEMLPPEEAPQPAALKIPLH